VRDFLKGHESSRRGHLKLILESAIQKRFRSLHNVALSFLEQLQSVFNVERLKRRMMRELVWQNWLTM
jgi:hypothetical protein